MLPLLPSATTSSPGFNWVGLVVLAVVAAVVWPLYTRLRDRLSRERRERWAREEGWDEAPRYTRDDDPDLRRD